MTVDWADLTKVVIGALGYIALAVVAGLEAVKKNEVKILERHCKLLEERASKVLMEHHKATKEGLEECVTQLKSELEEKDQTIQQLQDAKGEGSGVVDEAYANRVIAEMYETEKSRRDTLESRLARTQAELDQLKARTKESANNAVMNHLIREEWRKTKDRASYDCEILGTLTGVWETIMEELDKPGSVEARSLLREAVLYKVSEGSLIIGFHNDSFREFWDRSTYGRTLADAIRNVTGYDLKVHAAVIETSDSQ
jgi:hypothetical protein